jgi:hypothetical protein
MARAWPPIVFIAVSIGSLFLLRGTSGEWRLGIGMDDATPPGESAELHDLEREDPPVRHRARSVHHGAGGE